MARPTLTVIAGPNGAGKSTIYEAFVRHLTDAEFVNADRLALERFGHPAETLAESAAGQAEAERRRDELLAAGESLVIESTFSHPSKLDFIERAREAGYRIVVFHVNVATAEKCVERVRARVAEGGHPVPEDRIRARYERNQPLIRNAVIRADRGYVFDATADGEPPRLLITSTRGEMHDMTPELPAWVLALYGRAPPNEDDGAV